jgi:hypothetical protein
VLVSVLASKLSFFPKYQISLESAGFKHQLIICSYNEKTDQFAIADPIADFTGTISSKDLQIASIEGEKLLLWYMEFPKERKFPTSKQIYQRACDINFLQAIKSNKAFVSVQADLSRLPSLEAKEQITWIDQNNLAITTIIKVRQNVWQCFCDLDMLTSEQIDTGQAYVDSIVKHWMLINFQLMKIKRNPFDTQLLHSIGQRIHTVQQEEFQFLKAMYNMHKN